MKQILIIVLFCCFICGVNAQKIITYPISDSIPQNKDFTVKVRIPGGQWKNLYEYEVLVDAHNVRKSSMVNFEFDGMVEVAVISNFKKIKSHIFSM